MIRSERAGSNYGLRFQVFVNISDYLPTTEAAGVRITVHSPSEQPFPDTHGYSAPTGFVSSFAIRLVCFLFLLEFFTFTIKVKLFF